MQEIEDFTGFGFHEVIEEAISSMGFKTPTPIQIQAIPEVMQGRDLIACAQTGTGKTGAFLLPLLNKLFTSDHVHQGIRALIVVPTRELALQIDQQLEAMAYFTNLSSIAIYGGGDGSGFDVQKKALQSGVDVVIATPGKLLSHLNLGYVKTDHLQTLILDEADRMLDMGFIDDIVRINKYLPSQKQVLMFSATMAGGIRRLAKTLLNHPVELSLSIAKPAAGVTQQAYLVREEDKANLLKHILDTNKDFEKIIVFGSTKSVVKNISFKLQAAKYPAKSIHSDKEQSEREQILSDFKNGKLRILIGTDVISRGIDIDNINLVLNYNVPDDAADYVHRIGRTARASNKGLAITFINEKERRNFLKIEELIESSVEKMPLPQGYAPGPNFDLQDIKEKRRMEGGNNNKPGGRRPGQHNHRKPKPQNKQQSKPNSHG
jgi:ATP-dependent RNA helicase RhlE